MTNITQQNTSNMAESLNYTRLYRNVAKNTDLNWSEKAILSEIITSHAKGKAFMGTDLQLSKALDIDQGNVNKYIGQLAKRGIITKVTTSIASHSGGKPKRRRTILVIELESWIDDSKKPVFTALNQPKKRKPKAIAKRKSTKKVKEDLTSDITPSNESIDNPKDNVPVIEDMEQIIAVEADEVVEIEASEIEPITINSIDNINTSDDISEFLNAYPNYTELPEININLDFGNNEIYPEKALFAKMVDGVNKYILIDDITSYHNKTGRYKQH